MDALEDIPMTFDTAVNLAREIGHKVRCPAFVYTEPGSMDFNFRFGRPIEDIPGTTAVSLARVNVDGTMIHLAGPTGVLDAFLAKNREDMRIDSAAYDIWLANRR